MDVVFTPGLQDMDLYAKFVRVVQAITAKGHAITLLARPREQNEQDHTRSVG
jgi:hypothetical protein